MNQRKPTDQPDPEQSPRPSRHAAAVIAQYIRELSNGSR
jgi:hypothetical protein